MENYETTSSAGGGQTTVLVNPPPPKTHKTDGITRTEWINLFNAYEQAISTKTKALLDDMSANFSYLSGAALMDTLYNEVSLPGITYRDLLRNVFFHFESATYPPGINIASPNVASAMAIQVSLGLLTQARADVISQGAPL